MEARRAGLPHPPARRRWRRSTRASPRRSRPVMQAAEQGRPAGHPRPGGRPHPRGRTSMPWPSRSPWAARMQNIVVDRRGATPRRAIALPQAAGRRPRHLPAPDHHPRLQTLRETGRGQESGLCGRGQRSWWTYDPRYDEHRFRTCWAAPWWWRIWTAASPWPGNIGNRFRIVTLDGQVINRWRLHDRRLASAAARASCPAPTSWNGCSQQRRTCSAQQADAAQQAGGRAARAADGREYELEVAQDQQRRRRD